MLRLISGILAVAVVACFATATMAAKADAKPKKTPEERFEKADKNGDKKLSLEEFLGKRTGEMKEKATKRFKKLDKDGDESLTLEEYKAAVKKKKK
jgi:EF-hand domain pair